MKAKTKSVQKKTTKKKKIVTKSLYPIRKASDVPVTQGMLLEAQKMVINAIKSVNTKIGSMDKKFDYIDFKIESIDKRFDSIDKRFDSIEMKLDSFIEEMRADRHQMKVLMETQESRNKIVLEGYEQLYFRQDRLEVKTEERLKNIETVVFNKISESNK